MIFSHPIYDRSNRIWLALAWLISSFFGFAVLHPFLLDTNVLVKISVSLLAGAIFLVITLKMVHLGPLLYSWLFFSALVFVVLYEDASLDYGIAAKMIISLGLGAGVKVAILATVFIIAAPFDALERAWAYYRLSPVEKLSYRIASMTKKGRRERAQLKARLTIVANSIPLRRLLYYDLHEGQWCFAGYWEEDEQQDQNNGEMIVTWVNRKDLGPMSPEQEKVALQTSTPLRRTVYHDPQNDQYWLASYREIHDPKRPYHEGGEDEDPIQIRIREDLEPISPERAQEEIARIRKAQT